MIMARESILRSVFYPGLFLFFVVLLVIMLFCTFGRTNFFSFYLFFESSIYPRRKSLRYPLDRRLGGPQNRYGRRGEEENLAPTGTRSPTPWSSSP
jgi:hypothetical protein